MAITYTLWYLGNSSSPLVSFSLMIYSPHGLSLARFYLKLHLSVTLSCSWNLLSGGCTYSRKLLTFLWFLSIFPTAIRFQVFSIYTVLIGFFHLIISLIFPDSLPLRTIVMIFWVKKGPTHSYWRRKIMFFIEAILSCRWWSLSRYPSPLHSWRNPFFWPFVDRTNISSLRLLITLHCFSRNLPDFQISFRKMMIIFQKRLFHWDSASMNFSEVF